MDILQTIALALIQGVTEFLPVSSSAHLILLPRLTAWKDQGLSFDVAVHFGTLAAVVHYFRRDIRTLATGWMANFTNPSHVRARLGWMIIVATAPAVIIGFLAGDWIENHLRSPIVIAIATMFFGLLLLLSQRFAGDRDLSHMLWYASLLIGLFQSLAFIPGTSRSGVTITAALFLGFSLSQSARFSFWLSIPLIFAASVLQGYKWLQAEGGVAWFNLLVATVVAALSAWGTIGLFMRFVEKIGMLPFVMYRLLLGGFILLLFLPSA